jgi:hypothetical protein
VTLEEMFGLTPDEERRVAKLAVPTKQTAAEQASGWRDFAWSAVPSILAAYADREITFERMVAVTRAVSIGCAASDRAILTGYVATRGLTLKPTHHRNAKPPVYPMALRHVAVDLVESYRGHDSRPALEECVRYALRMLNQVRLFPQPPKASTLMRWYRERMKATNRAAARGRPRKQKHTDTLA